MDDSTWVARCVARLIELDPALDPELARPVVEDMCGRLRWRGMVPEVAAQVVFDLDMRRS
ncbi:MAG TPA: hypothetical protein VIP10_13825 [Burkholderiaceae bacterium]